MSRVTLKMEELSDAGPADFKRLIDGAGGDVTIEFTFDEGYHSTSPGWLKASSLAAWYCAETFADVASVADHACVAVGLEQSDVRHEFKLRGAKSAPLAEFLAEIAQAFHAEDDGEGQIYLTDSAEEWIEKRGQKKHGRFPELEQMYRDHAKHAAEHARLNPDED